MEYLSQRNCPGCEQDLGYPNVRRAERGAAELQRRYDDAKQAHSGQAGVIGDFEQAVAQDSQIVIAVNREYLEWLLKSKDSLYTNYHRQVQGEARLPAQDRDHIRRSETDERMFPGYKDEIVMGALSLDNTGLWSYGLFHLTLSENMIHQRTTFTHANTFQYQSWSKDVIGGDGYRTWEELLGYRSDWGGRAMLAVAKLAGHLTPAMQRDDFAAVLLRTDGNRATDDFIEAHVYGKVTPSAVSCVRAPTDAETARFDPASFADVPMHRNGVESKVNALNKKGGLCIAYACGN